MARQEDSRVGIAALSACLGLCIAKALPRYRGRAFETVEKVAAPLFREGSAALCASVVRQRRTIRRSLREKYFL